MKKIFIIVFVLGSLLSACSDSFLDEDPKGRLTATGAFNSAADLDLGITALYARINVVFNASACIVPYMGGNDITTRAGSNKHPYREYDLFSATDENDRANGTWGTAYAAVLAANHIIANYQDAVLASEQERNEAAAQAYFVRAISYFYLVRIWNEIPLVTTPELDFEIEKSPAVDVYNQIIEDLEFAEEHLPVAWEEESLRDGVAPTGGSVKSLMASVYLAMAGYPVNDQSKYALAAEKSKEVIDNASLYGYRLLDNYADLWTEAQFNDEMVFSLVYNRNISPWTWSNGNMRAPLASKPEEEGGWDDYFAEINFFYDFPEGPRKDATFQTVIRPNETDTLDWTEGVQRHPYYKKMRDMQGYNPDEPWAWVDWWSSRTNMLIRYSEVLLTYAEAQAMSGGVDQTAYDAVDAVRTRAGLDPLTTGLSQTDFRDSVIMERAWEFAGAEPLTSRWLDLVRLERVEAAAQDRHEWELPLINTPTKDNYFAPIPIGDKLINPEL